VPEIEYVAAITVYDPAITAERTLYYTSGLGFTTTTTDTPAETLVAPRVVQPALLRRDIFDIGTTGGASRVGFGELVLANQDGALDAFRTYAVDGRTLTVYTGTPGGAFPGAWSILFRGTMDQADTTLDAVTIRLRDRQAFAEQPLQRVRYGGTNALPDGTDGTEGDLKDKPKPVLLGWVYNISPPSVNTSRLIYQVHDGAIRDIMAVYDSGALLGRGLDYTDTTDLLSNEPAPGTYRVLKAAGMFRLGSTPIGALTCDAVQGTLPSDRTAAALFLRVLDEYAGLDPSLIDAVDLAALDVQQPAQLGFWYDEATSVQDVLDDIASSVGAWWASDSAGLLRIVRLAPPSGTPAFTIGADRLLSFVRLPMSDADRSLPVNRVVVRCRRNYTVQTSGLAGAVRPARRARLASPWQQATANDAAVLTVHPLSPERAVETGMACFADAQAEATRLLTLYGTQRDRYEITIATDATTQAAIDLGVVVRLQYARYGLDAGRDFRIIGYQLDPVANTAALTLWG
jgi:hypothetical protein